MMTSQITLLTSSEDITTDSIPDPPREINNAPASPSVNNEAKGDTPEKSPGNSTGAQQKQQDEHLKPPCGEDSSRSRSRSPTSDTPKSQKHGARKKRSAGSTEYYIQNSTNIQIGPSYTVVMQGGAKNAQTMVNSERKQAKELYNEMKTKVEQVTATHLKMISTHVGENWRDLGRELLFTDGQLGRIKLDNIAEGMKEVVYQMLLEWIRSNGSDATIGKLIRALWKSEEYSAIRILGSPVEDDK